MLPSNQLLIPQDQIIHIIGIGGICMSAIARILHNMGYLVQGSEITEGPSLKVLHELGIKIFTSQKAANIGDATLVVRSSAIADDNVEVVAAKKRKIKLISRAEILTELLKFKHTIAISGTHGKTTTTSMLGAILEFCDPTIISGGIMSLYNDNLRLGEGNWNVVEADESDGTFVALQKSVAIVTNIESDHIDYYKSYENLLDHFNRFAQELPFYGFCIICEKSAKLIGVASEKIVTYGTETADLQSIDIKYEQGVTNFNIVTSSKLGNIKISNLAISVPGDHNVKNATAAIGVALKLGIAPEKIKLGLKRYIGVKRRFSYIGKFKGADIIDDYAHHPTEIITTISTAKRLCEMGEKVIAVIEPHRYSRVQSMFADYINISLHCDYIIFLPVFAAGEQIINGCSSSDIVINAKLTNKYIELLESKDDLREELNKIVNKGDKILFMGAGKVSKYADSLV